MAITKIGKIARVFNGYAFKSSKYVESGYQVIRIKNVQDGFISNKDQKFIELSSKSFERFILNAGDILISLTGNVGRVAKVRQNNLPAVLNQRVGKMVIESKHLFPDYLYHMLKSKTVTSRLIEKGKGIAQKNIGASDIENIEIPLPSLEDQQRIVRILDKADSLRQKRKQAIALLDDYLKSVFMEMFGDPVRNPKGWDVIKFGDIVSDIRYGSSRKSVTWPVEDSVQILRIPNITNGLVNSKGLQYQVLPSNEKAKLILEEGDILFVRTNGNPDFIGRCAVFTGDHESIFASYLIRTRLHTESQFAPLFVRYVFSMDSYKKRIRRESRTTAGNYNINTKGIKNFDLIKVPLDLQEQFIEVLSNVESVKDKMLTQSEELETQFQALLQKALKGKL